MSEDSVFCKQKVHVLGSYGELVKAIRSVGVVAVALRNSLGKNPRPNIGMTQNLW